MSFAFARRRNRLFPLGHGSRLVGRSRRFLQKAGETDRRDLFSRAVLIDLAVIADRKDIVEATLVQLAGLEGIDGPIRSLAIMMTLVPGVRAICAQSTPLDSFAGSSCPVTTVKLEQCSRCVNGTPA